MKRLAFALGACAVRVVAAAAAHAVNICAYKVTRAVGVFCAVHLGDVVCLNSSAAIGSCDDVLRCYAGNRAFCDTKVELVSGPQPVCPRQSKRPPGLHCFKPERVPPRPTPTPISTEVAVSLYEFFVVPNQHDVPAGHVTFHVSNIGEDMHEFLVIRTDLPPDGLPTNADGSYMEDGPGTDLLDEIDLVPSGESRDLQIDLTPGKYVLICNMVHMEDNGEVEVHYQLGMRTAFTVH